MATQNVRLRQLTIGEEGDERGGKMAIASSARAVGCKTQADSASAIKRSREELRKD
jgi:hypothetical protein